MEVEAEFVINQIHGRFDFYQTNGSTKRFTEQSKPREKIYQSQHGTRKSEQNKKVHSREATTSSIGVNSISPNKRPKSKWLPLKAKWEKVIGIDMYFIYEKRGPSPETIDCGRKKNEYWTLRKQESLGKEAITRGSTSIAPHNEAENRSWSWIYGFTTSSSTTAVPWGQPRWKSTIRIITKLGWARICQTPKARSAT